MKKVTILDIAEELSMSRNTVSKAIKGNDSVAPKTRKRIIAKAIQMGYSKISDADREANEAASIGTAKRIAVLTRREVSEFWSRILLGITDITNKNGYSCLFHFVTDEDMEKANVPVEMLKNEVDGIICMSIFSKNYFLKLFEMDIPTVCYDIPLGIKSTEIHADRVLVEGYHNVYDITASMLKSGKKSIGFLGDINYCRTVLDRWHGYRNALDDYNVPFEEKYVETSHVTEKYYEYTKFSEMMDSMKELPEGFVCVDDVIAIFLVQYLTAKDYRIPEDIAVAGFDDQSILKTKNFFLTTVHVDNEYLGARMAEQLLYRIKHPERPAETIFVETRIVYRETTIQ